jgi:hypothetical protein
MKKERFKLLTFVSLILRREKEVLMLRRYSTKYNDGLYHFPGEKIDGNESIA